MCVHTHINKHIYIYMYTHTRVSMFYVKQFPRCGFLAASSRLGTELYGYLRSAFKNSCLFLRPRPW